MLKIKNLSPQKCGGGIRGEKMNTEYGIQLYSIRDYAEKDLQKALELVAGLGYKYVEFAGFFGNTSMDVKEMLDYYGLKCSGTHSSFEDLTPSNIAATIEYHTEIGNPYYIIPGADLLSLEKIERFASIVNYAQPILAAEGIKLGYHNHSREFAPQKWGFSIYSEIERRTNLNFEVDTFWAFDAGLNSIELIERLGSRCDIIHLKDGFRGGIGVPLGEGEAPVLEVRDYAVKHNLKIVIESETLNPDGYDEAKRCIEFLRNNE